MLAIRQYEFGPPERLVHGAMERPVAREGEMLIAVEAAGVHLVDTVIRAGSDGGPFPLPTLPMVPGREVAGRVDDVGDGVDHDWIGRRVVAHLGMASGGYAEFAVAKTASVHEIADSLDAAAAVAMIGTGRTAAAILDVAQLTRDDRVLVTAAAGGLGTLLVQAAHRTGATVVGVAGGPRKTELVRELGAAIAIDYLEGDWPERVREALPGRVTVVLDGVGGTNGRAALELLAPGGRLVLFGWSSGEPTRVTTDDLYSRGISATAAIGQRIAAYPGGLRALEARALGTAAAGDLKPVVQTFPLANAAAAHRALERRETVGKVVLTVERK